MTLGFGVMVLILALAGSSSTDAFAGEEADQGGSVVLVDLNDLPAELADQFKVYLAGKDKDKGKKDKGKEEKNKEKGKKDKGKAEKGKEDKGKEKGKYIVQVDLNKVPPDLLKVMLKYYIEHGEAKGHEGKDKGEKKEGKKKDDKKKDDKKKDEKKKGKAEEVED
jgi:hypothetical protein